MRNVGAFSEEDVRRSGRKSQATNFYVPPNQEPVRRASFKDPVKVAADLSVSCM